MLSSGHTSENLQRKSILNQLYQCSPDKGTCANARRRRMWWQQQPSTSKATATINADRDDEVLSWLLNALRMRMGMRIEYGIAQLRAMKKLVIFRILAACIFTLCILTFFQLRLDDSNDRKLHFPVEDLHTDGDVGISSYNVCSIPNLKMLGRDSSYLPRQYRVFSEPIEHTLSCLSSRKPKFLQKSLLPVCKKLFTAQPLNRLQEKWIEDVNKLIASKDSEEELVHKSFDCDWLRDELSNNFFISAKERSFPIAYAINVDRAPNQILEFLRVIYRPHNLYCFHFDSKSGHHVKTVISNIASCFGNVIVSRKIESVNWGWHTIQDAFLNCFTDLSLARGTYPWRYIITLCGMEVPLRTNAEIVALLEPLNGTSSVQLVGKDGVDDFKFKWKWSLNKVTGWITKRDSPLPPIPYGLKVYKSWAYNALSHQFVHFLLCSPEGNTFKTYMKDVRIPEENTFAMLFMRPNTPGGYRTEHSDKIFPVTNLIWLDGGGSRNFLEMLYLVFFPKSFCAGTIRHGICQVQAMDLHRLAYRPGISPMNELESNLNPNMGREYKGRDRGPLFHNKYSMARDRVVIECMQQELAHRNAMEYQSSCTP